MQNVNHRTPFLYILFIQTKKNKQNTTVFKIHKESLIILLGNETAKDANFMQHMLITYSPCYFSSLEGDMRKCKNIKV